jgi:apolipoprotein D and lipocalin family protein
VRLDRIVKGAGLKNTLKKWSFPGDLVNDAGFSLLLRNCRKNVLLSFVEYPKPFVQSYDGSAMKIPLLILGFLFGSAYSLAGDNSSKPPLGVVPSIDLNRYIGTWYEIARLPNRFQKKCTGDVTATYTLLNDGTIKVVNRCRTENGEMTEAEGKARRASDDEPNSKLEVRFAPGWLSWLPFVWGNYWVIDLADDYSYAVVGEPDREYLWILSRTPRMDDAVYQRVLENIRNHGYDTEALVKTIQKGQKSE